jgi:hypothetical protein
MYPSCKDCRHYSQWSLRCSQPYLMQHYSGPLSAITMRDLDEACGSTGRWWEVKPGIVYSVVDWMLKKTGMKDY